MAYSWSSFIGIGIGNTFFMKYMYWYGLYFLKVLLTTLMIMLMMIYHRQKASSRICLCKAMLGASLPVLLVMTFQSAANRDVVCYVISKYY